MKTYTITDEQLRNIVREVVRAEQVPLVTAVKHLSADFEALLHAEQNRTKVVGELVRDREISRERLNAATGPSRKKKAS